MKKFILSALIAVFSVSASAQGNVIESESDHSQLYQQTALELLVAAKDSVSTNSLNDTQRDARPIIQDAFIYLASETADLMGAIIGFDDDEEPSYQGDIKDVKFACNLNIAHCRLEVTHKNSNSLTRIDYKLNVENNMPVSIKNNSVTLSVSER